MSRKPAQFYCRVNTNTQFTLWLTYTPLLPNTPTTSTLSQTRGYSLSVNKFCASDTATQSAVLLKHLPFITTTMFYLRFRIYNSSFSGEIKTLHWIKVNLAGFLLHHTYRFHSQCLWLSLFLATAHFSGYYYGPRQFVWAWKKVHNWLFLAFKPDLLLIQSPSHYLPIVHKSWSYKTVKHLFKHLHINSVCLSSLFAFISCSKFLSCLRLTLPEEPPSAPPQTVIASGRTNQSIMIQWQPPPENHQNGLLQGYIIRWDFVPSHTHKRSHCQNYPPPPTTTRSASIYLQFLCKKSSSRPCRTLNAQQ